MSMASSQPLRPAATATGAAKPSATAAAAPVTDAAAEKAAKAFESVLLGKLFDSMRATIPDSGLFENDMEQTQSIFWTYLAQDVGAKGGFGLWKQLYKQIKKDGLGGSSTPLPSSELQNVMPPALDPAVDSKEEAGSW
jgi:Rod binding domain-containing protein